MSEYRVNVYEDGYLSEVVGRVRYNEDLDYWDGSRYGNGGVGYHKGITKLKDGRYVIIFGSEHQESRDYAVIVNKEAALYAILESNHLELLEDKKYRELKDMYNNLLESLDKTEVMQHLLKYVPGYVL